MKEVLFVILDQYADWEAASVAAAINDGHGAGGNAFCVKTVSASKEPVRSIGGFATIPDYDLASVPDDFAALLLIGGNTWRTETAKKVAPLVKKAVEQKLPVGAICDATVFLGMNGFLNGVRHTSNTLDSLKEAAKDNYTGEKLYIEEQAVSDGNIITANGTAFLEFGREVLQALRVYPQAEIDEWYGFYKYGYYEAVKKKTQGQP
jgi:putative intracellular protease/amidase